jgi:hypothetical protein
LRPLFGDTFRLTASANAGEQSSPHEDRKPDEPSNRGCSIVKKAEGDGNAETALAWAVGTRDLSKHRPAHHGYNGGERHYHPPIEPPATRAEPSTESLPIAGTQGVVSD